MQNVYFNHDGNVDDLVSLLLLLQMPDINLTGVGVVGADSFVEPAVSASRKIVDLFGSKSMVKDIAKSNSHPVHQFPTNWRLSSFSFDNFPMLNESGKINTPLAEKVAHLDMIDKLQNETEKTTLVMTGPLTDLARALEIDPTITKKIDKLFWMGGTMNNQGNVNDPEHDGTAEWNAFWDPQAVKTVFDADIEIQMIGLESTDQVPLTVELRDRWSKERRFPALDLIGQGYALVLTFEADSKYYLWDVLTAMSFKYPETIESKSVYGDVIVDGPAAGRTFIKPNGRKITLVTAAHETVFYDKIDELLQQAAAPLY